MNIVTKFDYKERVKIIDLNLCGRITAIEYNCMGLQYKVDYFANGEIHSPWLFEEDLQQMEESDKLTTLKN